jgi:O-antigen ligase
MVLSLIVAAYLLLSIVLGGSAQGVWGNLALQLLGIFLLVLVAVVRPAEPAPAPARALFALLLLGLIVVAIQLVPLPMTSWKHLPGRESIAEGLSALGYGSPALPISFTPYDSVMTLFAVIPATSIFLATLRLAPSGRLLALSVLVGTILGILLGVLQVQGGRESWAYLYRITNTGAVGFFANQNHMATLLLVSIPMAAAILGSAKMGPRTAAGRYATGAAILALILVGIGLNGSLAAFGLLVPVLIASVLLLPGTARWRRLALPASLAALVVGGIFIAYAPIAAASFQSEASTSVNSRVAIWKVTSEAIHQTFPVGTGLGSFEEVYRQFEPSDRVTSEYVNHAHNDYLELVLELGLAGLVLIPLFLIWWAVTTVRIWRSHSSTVFARAATIGTAAILTQSAVDFPLRTAAISVIFAALLALMARQFNAGQGRATGEFARSRHVKLG